MPPKKSSWLDQARESGLVARETAVNAAALVNSVKLIELEVVVPPPPSTNNLFLSAGKRRVKTAEYRSWLELAIPTLARLKPPELPCEIYLYLVGNWNENRDGSNTVKAVEDALVAAGVIPDDSLKYVRRGVWACERADCDPVVRVRFSP